MIHVGARRAENGFRAVEHIDRHSGGRLGILSNAALRGVDVAHFSNIRHGGEVGSDAQVEIRVVGHDERIDPRSSGGDDVDEVADTDSNGGASVAGAGDIATHGHLGLDKAHLARSSIGSAELVAGGRRSLDVDRVAGEILTIEPVAGILDGRLACLISKECERAVVAGRLSIDDLAKVWQNFGPSLPRTAEEHGGEQGNR